VQVPVHTNERMLFLSQSGRMKKGREAGCGADKNVTKMIPVILALILMPTHAILREERMYDGYKGLRRI
jgi:hypothetical protein